MVSAKKGERPLTGEGFFVSVLLQAQKRGGQPMTMRKICPVAEAAEVVRHAVALAIANGVLEQGDALVMQINKIEGDAIGHA